MPDGLCRSEWEKLGQVVAGPDAEDTMAVGGKSLYGRTWVSQFKTKRLCVPIRHLCQPEATDAAIGVSMGPDP